MRPVGGFSSPDDEAVRFRVNPRLGFPASEIQQLELHDDAPAEMMVNFMGLTGPMGVLPYAYSEFILERLRAKDSSFASFLDIFNHRAISLFYPCVATVALPGQLRRREPRLVLAIPARSRRARHCRAPQPPGDR